MSAAVYLKQSIYQLSSSDLVKTLSKYYSSSSHTFSASTTQKAYKCFECCIMVDNSKYCAGFGRNEDEATLNAGRIALESIVDSGEILSLKKIMENDDIQVSELEKFLTKLEARDYVNSFTKEKLDYNDLSKMNLESLRLFVPIGLASKIHSQFHPSNTEVLELREMNEV
ncbi:hypothetical protein SteCoe_8606 [Stentor coeruleus]|uniref:Uncharacterized protein n=1 Tax=Stentor coeruleus TaxID=5963 RepID=A0A1R2CJY3_9CILI|nr:hypothetical protein SteCoe_8606 [Stentor coeruleus]